MAQGTREVGRLQDDYDKEVGQQITDFLRFKGLEDAASNVNMRVTGGGRPERTLIGTGTNPGITYAHLNEMANGPVRMSRLARSMVQQNSPLNPNTPVWDNDLQQYISANQKNLQQRQQNAYWDRINQKNMDELNAGDFLHPAKGDISGDPEAQMRQITAQADESARDPNMKQNPDYAGPGANFYAPPLTEQYTAEQQQGQVNPEQDTASVSDIASASDIASGPSQFWHDVAQSQTDYAPQAYQ